MNRYLEYFLIAVFVLFALPAKAQIYEVGATGGISAYMGDLNTDKVFNKIWGGGGVMLRYNHNEHISARVNAYHTVLRGSDKRESQPYVILPPGKKFEFKTTLYELSFQAEINFLPFVTGDIDTRFTPYLFAGLGGIYFDPRGYRDLNASGLVKIDFDENPPDEWGNEKKPNEYSNLSIISIIGYGFKFNLSNNFIAGFEWGVRYAGAPFFKKYGTDYLDMVSLKGNPKTNDWYSVLGLTFTYKFLDRSRPPCPNYNL